MCLELIIYTLMDGVQLADVAHSCFNILHMDAS